MPNILIRNVLQRTISLLKEKAKRDNRTLQGEVKYIIEENAKMSMEDALRRARKRRASFGKKTFSDSAALLREGREIKKHISWIEDSSVK